MRARGHRTDWDFFAAEAGDPTWNYDSFLDIYHRIEDWHGRPDPAYRGVSGPVFIEPAPDPNPIAPAIVETTGVIGIPMLEN
jgi:choline dehydrogenase